MGIFTSLFGNKNKQTLSSDSRLVDLFTPYFSSSVNPELNDTFMNSIFTHAKHISKIKPIMYKNDVEDKEKSYLSRLLSLSPNPITEAGSFWERAAINYFQDNNLFIYIDWNIRSVSEPIRGLWIIDPDNVQVKHDTESGSFYLKFMVQGRTVIASLDDIIHIARNVNSTEIFGQFSPAINKVLSVINTNYDGIENAIRSSGFLRFVLSSTTLMKDEDRQKKAELFARTYLAKDGTGIAYLDSSTDLKQVNSQAKYANAEEMKHFEEKIQKYLNISDPILKADFTEIQWQSYYETNIETFINKLKNELEIKLLTKNQYNSGCRVSIPSNILEVASLVTKTNLINSLKDIGILSVNEIRKTLNMPTVSDGDKRFVSLNYINSEIVDEYQLKKKGATNDGQQ